MRSSISYLHMYIHFWKGSTVYAHRLSPQGIIHFGGDRMAISACNTRMAKQAHLSKLCEGNVDQSGPGLALQLLLRVR
jgi:hypothetical protein